MFFRFRCLAYASCKFILSPPLGIPFVELLPSGNQLCGRVDSAT